MSCPYFKISFYPPDLVNTKTTIPLRRYTSRYIHYYSPLLQRIIVYYFEGRFERKLFPATQKPRWNKVFLVWNTNIFTKLNRGHLEFISQSESWLRTKGPKNFSCFSRSFGHTRYSLDQLSTRERLTVLSNGNIKTSELGLIHTSRSSCAEPTCLFVSTQIH